MLPHEIQCLRTVAGRSDLRAYCRIWQLKQHTLQAFPNQLCIIRKQNFHATILPAHPAVPVSELRRSFPGLHS